MSNTLKLLNQKPIAYYPLYRQLTGSTTGGILLSQLMYWFSKKDKIFKTDKEIMSETLLTENELRTAKKRIKNLNFITVTREGIPGKTYYKIDWEIYETCLVKFTSTDKLNSQAQISEIHETNKNNNFNTETTTETTTEINKNKNKKSLQSQTLEKVSEHIDNINAAALDEWLDYKHYKNIAPITKTINFLVKFDMNTQQQIIDNSIMNGYKGLFPPKQLKSFNEQDRERQDKELDAYLNSGYSLEEDLARSNKKTEVSGYVN